MTKPTLDDMTARVMRGCQILKEHDLPDVAALLARTELHDRKGKAGTGKRKAYVGNKRTKANETYIDHEKIAVALELEQIEASGVI